MSKKIILLIISLSLIILSIIFLGKGFLRSYVLIKHAIEKSPTHVQVIAKINKKNKPFVISNIHYFNVNDESGDTMDVIYTGNLPDNFYHSEQTVLQGHYDKKTNRFIAKKILLKCPSKYKEKKSK